MTVENVLLTCKFQAGEDLNTHQYQAIALNDGKVANSGDEAVGILLTKPKSAEHGTVGISGLLKYRAGAAVAVDAKLTATTSGYIITCGSGYYFFGRALEAVTSGSVGLGQFDFSAPCYRVSSC